MQHLNFNKISLVAINCNYASQKGYGNKTHPSLCMRKEFVTLVSHVTYQFDPLTLISFIYDLRKKLYQCQVNKKGSSINVKNLSNTLVRHTIRIAVSRKRMSALR